MGLSPPGAPVRPLPRPDGLRHRPLSVYMTALIGAGLELTHFGEPAPHDGPPERVARYRQAPFAMMMEWRKPG